MKTKEPTKPVETFYYVLREHTCDDNDVLWKVMSRRNRMLPSAEGWMEFCQQQDKKEGKQYKYFIVSKQEVP